MLVSLKILKVFYRKCLVKHTLARINDASLDGVNASTISKSVDILLAIRWIKQAWELVTADTVKNCFRRCGISPESGRSAQSEDPFADLDTETKHMDDLDELVEELHCGLTGDEYVNAEDGLTTYFTFDGAGDTNWREKLRKEVLSDYGSAPKRAIVELDESSDEEDEVTSIQTYDTALTLAKDLQLFFFE